MEYQIAFRSIYATEDHSNLLSFYHIYNTDNNENSTKHCKYFLLAQNVSFEIKSVELRGETQTLK